MPYSRRFAFSRNLEAYIGVKNHARAKFRLAMLHAAKGLEEDVPPPGPVNLAWSDEPDVKRFVLGNGPLQKDPLPKTSKELRSFKDSKLGTNKETLTIFYDYCL